MPHAASTARSPQAKPGPVVAGSKAVSSASKSGLTGKTLGTRFIQSGISPAGTKMPEMNSSGSTITLATGGAAFSEGTRPEAANHSAARANVPTTMETIRPGSDDLG